MTFGEYIKERRRKSNLTLRAFCDANGYDPGNHSRLERGELNPPEDDQKMKELAQALGIKVTSSDWFEFYNLAHIARGQIPKILLDDADVVAKLPVLLRTLEGEPLAPQKMEELIAFIRSRQ